MNMKLIDQPTEDALQALAHELEEIAEELRARAWTGRRVTVLDGTHLRLARALRVLDQKYGAVMAR
jgi:hypothetical protein